jgi:Domain of unknown function (DUF5658)
MSAMMTSYVVRHGPMTFAAVLLIIVLCVADSFFTIEIVSRGGQELNPIMAYYLNQSPLLFFVIKYSLTCAAIILMLSVKIHYIFGIRIRAEVFLGSFLIVLALVVQWQLFLISIATD